MSISKTEKIIEMIERDLEFADKKLKPILQKNLETLKLNLLFSK